MTEPAIEQQLARIRDWKNIGIALVTACTAVEMLLLNPSPPTNQSSSERDNDT